MADGRLVGQRRCTGVAPCSTGAAWSYFVLDHLDSVSVVTDGGGTAIARESFDAWGRQRNANGTDDPACALGTSSPNTRRFTSQEHIDALCLINLNARLYDPTIGRFLTPDSVVPDPSDAQSYNRYTYVDNRPLSFTDPTGQSGCQSNSAETGCWNPGSQADGADPYAHPEMEGVFLGSAAGAASAAGAKNITISRNSDGSQQVTFTCSGGNAS
ncbi:MAG TPA: RHS repeat-associated core domain-containing protein, partial [Candidatus Paceibacterota bacterium]|nr:RHS repeat-associated core domain-containing protein [Candidatus Paceibacterota bacterium]